MRRLLLTAALALTVVLLAGVSTTLASTPTFKPCANTRYAPLRLTIRHTFPSAREAWCAAGRPNGG